MWPDALGPFVARPIPHRWGNFLGRTPHRPPPTHGSLGASFLVPRPTSQERFSMTAYCDYTQ